jgi:hypothetical protein
MGARRRRSDFRSGRDGVGLRGLDARGQQNARETRGETRDGEAAAADQSHANAGERAAALLPERDTQFLAEHRVYSMFTPNSRRLGPSQ